MKLATHLNSTVLQGVGLAMVIASIFQPRESPLENTLYAFGLTLIWVGVAVRAYVWGYEKGHREARLIITTEVRRPYDWPRSGSSSLKDAVTRTETMLTEESELWEALSQSRDAEPTEGIMWGTDYWGDIMSEPSEEQARTLGKASASNVYSRQPHCEWVLDTHNTQGASK